MIAAVRPWSGPQVTVTGRERTPHWTDQARCAGMDVEIFYPVATAPAAARTAKAVCAQCPVKQACREAADNWGVWGGLTEAERGTARRSRRTTVDCRECGTRFKPVSSSHAYCSPQCSIAARNRSQARYDKRKKVRA